MNKYRLAVLGMLAWLAASHLGAQETAAQTPDTEPVTACVWLSQVKRPDTTRLPDTIHFAIKAKETAFYKLSLAGVSVGSGSLQPGMNQVAIAADVLIARSGSYSFVLDMKYPDCIVSIPFTCQVERTEPRGEEAAAPNASVSAFVDGVMLGSAQKKKELKFDSKARGEPHEMDYGPKSWRDGSNPSLERMSFPILALPFMAYQLIRDAKVKARLEADAHTWQPLRRMEIVLKRPDMPAGEFIVRVLVKLIL